MRVLVCGGRDFSDKAFAFRMLDRIHARCPITTLIEGGARGADRIGRLWAQRAGIEIATFNADWVTYGNRAGPIRNAQMLAEGKPDIVVALPGGSGTAHMVRISKMARVRVWVLNQAMESGHE